MRSAVHEKLPNCQSPAFSHNSPQVLNPLPEAKRRTRALPGLAGLQSTRQALPAVQTFRVWTCSGPCSILCAMLGRILRACPKNTGSGSAGLLPAACVGSLLTARRGDARSSPPWLRPKSLAAPPPVFFGHALRWPSAGVRALGPRRVLDARPCPPAFLPCRALPAHGKGASFGRFDRLRAVHGPWLSHVLGRGGKRCIGSIG